MKKEIDVFDRKIFCPTCDSVQWHSLIIKRATDDGVVFLKCCQKHNTESYKSIDNSQNWDFDTLPVGDWNAIILDRIFT